MELFFNITFIPPKYRYTNAMLKTICQVLDIERSGKQSVLIERIMAFLMHPVNTGKVHRFSKMKCWCVCLMFIIICESKFAAVNQLDANLGFLQPVSIKKKKKKKKRKNTAACQEYSV